jgi:hypothetical protein
LWTYCTEALKAGFKAPLATLKIINYWPVTVVDVLH